jgi:hypothetical protein
MNKSRLAAVVEEHLKALIEEDKELQMELLAKADFDVFDEDGHITQAALDRAVRALSSLTIKAHDPEPCQACPEYV